MTPSILALSFVLSPARAGADRVVGGEAAPAGVWPDVAAIVYGYEVGCTGVLIAPRAVLTAGHCAEGITSVILDTTDPDGHLVGTTHVEKP